MSENLRGTGRTTRMLQAAIAKAAEGKYVFVVLSSYQQVEYYTRWLPKDYSGRLKAVGGGKLYVDDAGGCIQLMFDREGFCWETLRPRRAHPTCEVFIDHFAIESRFAKVLFELNRFNEEKHSSAESSEPNTDSKKE